MPKNYTKEETEGKWITVKGRHILLKDGESVEDALSRSDRSMGKENKNNKPSNFENKAVDYVGGGVSPSQHFNKEELKYIKENATKTSKPLYRVEDSKFTADKLDEDDLDIDDFEFTGSVRSTTSDKDFIKNALDENSDDYAGIKNPVIFEITGSKKSFDMKPYEKEYTKHFKSQSEHLVGGKFKVVGEDYKNIHGKLIRIIKIEQHNWK